MLVHYRMRMITSHTGIWTRQRCFNTFSASVFSTDDRPRGSQCPELEDHDCENNQFPIDSEVVWDQLLQICKASWNWPKNPQRGGWCHKETSQWFLSCHGNPDRSQLTWSWQTLYQFSRTASGGTPVTPGVSVSLQWLVELWRRLFWEVLKYIWKTTHVVACIRNIGTVR